MKDTSEELSTTCASVESGTGSDNQAMVSSAMIAVIEQLQLLFINLLKSKRRYLDLNSSVISCYKRANRVIDATGFVDSLHLQHDRQQVPKTCLKHHNYECIVGCAHRMLKSSENCFCVNSVVSSKQRFVFVPSHLKYCVVTRT